MNLNNIQDGGFIGYLIIFLGILAIGLFVERLLAYRKEKADLLELESAILGQLRKGDHHKAQQIAEEGECIAAIVFSKILEDQTATDAILKEKLQEVAAVEIPHLWKNLNVLSLIVTIAPLLGLLGTVLGMLQSFQEIEDMAKLATGSYGPGVVAGGIKKALVTTILGLIVAIPVNVVYGYLSGLVESLTLQTERVSYEIINWLTSDKGAGK